MEGRPEGDGDACSGRGDPTAAAAAAPGQGVHLCPHMPGQLPGGAQCHQDEQGCRQQDRSEPRHKGGPGKGEAVCWTGHHRPCHAQTNAHRIEILVQQARRQSTRAQVGGAAATGEGREGGCRSQNHAEKKAHEHDDPAPDLGHRSPRLQGGPHGQRSASGPGAAWAWDRAVQGRLRGKGPKPLGDRPRPFAAVGFRLLVGGRPVPTCPWVPQVPVQPRDAPASSGIWSSST